MARGRKIVRKPAHRPDSGTRVAVFAVHLFTASGAARALAQLGVGVGKQLGQRGHGVFSADVFDLANDPHAGGLRHGRVGGFRGENVAQRYPLRFGARAGRVEGECLQLHLRGVAVFDFLRRELRQQVVDGLLDTREGGGRRGYP